MAYTINFTLNGEHRTIDVKSNQTLLDVLRYQLGVTSPKSGCERGECGTCTVMLDQKTVKSCLVLAVEVDGREVVTLEGLMNEVGGMTPLQETFLKNNSFQCGFCAPGMITAAEELLRYNPTPSDQEIKEALSGNLCRCTGYQPIIDAIRAYTARTGPNTAGEEK